MTAEPTIAYDLSRLFLGPLHGTPRGIDRVELGFTQQILEHWHGDVVGVLPTIAGMRVFDRSRVVDAVRQLKTMWREDIDPRSDQQLMGVRAALEDRAQRPNSALPSRRSWTEVVRRQIGLLRATGVSAGRPAARTLPSGSVYFNAGHISLTVPPLLAWLDRRSDIRPVFMIHDLIPIEHPAFGPASERKAHERILDNAARRASAIIVPSHCVRDALTAALLARGKTDIPITAQPLPVSDVFLRSSELPSPQRPYFVVVGRLDARKNHALVLDVWQRLLRERGHDTPRLAIVGSRGWGSDDLGDPRWSGLNEHIVFVDGMSTPGVRELVGGATALLAPSHAEGFGLTVVEALSVRTLVIASDIPAHREAGGDAVLYHNPSSADDWLSEIGRILDGDPGIQPIRARVAAFVPGTWPEYFASVATVLRG